MQQVPKDQGYFNEVVDFIQVVNQQQLSPNLLQFRQQLFNLIKNQTIRQRQQLKSYISTQSQQRTFQKNFKYQVYNTQLQKLDFILKQYLKIRLKKIQEYCFYFLKNDQALSKSQRSFLKKYAQLRYEHYKNTALKHLPKMFRDFKDVEMYLGGEGKERGTYVNTKQSQIEILAPNLQEHCFVKVINNIEEQIRFQNQGGYQQIIPQGSVLFCAFDSIAAKMDTQHYRLL